MTWNSLRRRRLISGIGASFWARAGISSAIAGVSRSDPPPPLPPIREEIRIALVIGNSDYNPRRLANPANDARLIATRLRQVGFRLVGAEPNTPVLNADRRTMKKAIGDFGDEIARSGSDSIALIYFSGHGSQNNGKNYLIPIGADIKDPFDLEFEAISAESILARMNYSSAALNIVVLDACRDDPFPSWSRSAQSGLFPMNGPHGSLIEYSTGAGEIASDGTGQNSPYALALAEAITIPGLELQQTFKRVRTSVVKATAGKQFPAEYTSFVGDFSFVREAPPASSSGEDLPETLPPVDTQGGAVFLSLAFEPDGTRLQSKSYDALDNLAKAMLDPALHGYSFEIISHIARSGKPADGVALSMLRAQAVVNYLISRGVTSSRLTPRPFGYLNPIAGTDPRSPVNNRVEIISSRSRD